MLKMKKLSPAALQEQDCQTESGIRVTAAVAADAAAAVEFGAEGGRFR